MSPILDVTSLMDGPLILRQTNYSVRTKWICPNNVIDNNDFLHVLRWEQKIKAAQEFGHFHAFSPLRAIVSTSNKQGNLSLNEKKTRCHIRFCSVIDSLR